MRAHAKLVAEKLRFAARLIAEARQLAAAADLDPAFAVQMLGLQEALAAPLLTAMTDVGPEYQEELQSLGHRRGALHLGDLIGRVLQMDLAHLEALAVDATFIFRAEAQKAIELREIVDGKVPARAALQLRRLSHERARHHSPDSWSVPGLRLHGSAGLRRPCDAAAVFLGG